MAILALSAGGKVNLLMKRELKALFGSDTLQECWTVTTDIRAGQAKRVAVLANQLSNIGTPEAQRSLVKSMAPADRLLLCRWLADREYAGNCISKGK
jgi:hypothetical protein